MAQKGIDERPNVAVAVAVAVVVAVAVARRFLDLCRTKSAGGPARASVVIAMPNPLWL